jgi:hypothetical protein
MSISYQALALFSGGLDSILAAKLVARQGLSVLCLHFTTPFYGHPRKVDHWRAIHGLDIRAVDLGREFVDMMHAPANGFGKNLNPCVDCKILLLTKAREMMAEYGASFLVTGEVVGQRPMSQRRDTLARISREAGVRDILLRPLCAKKLDPTPMELSGLVDRERLGALFGRGRLGQMDLAAEFGITEIPTPAGGCLLTETESAKRYLPLIALNLSVDPDDYQMVNIGRQYWSGGNLLAVGRTESDNRRLAEAARPGDLLFRLVGMPGPTGLGRVFPGVDWSPEAMAEAAAIVAWHAPKARQVDAPIEVAVRRDGQSSSLRVVPAPAVSFAPTSSEAVARWKKERQGA